MIRILATLIASTLFIASSLAAQTLTPLTPVSDFICVIAGKNNQVGKFTATGYRLVSSGAAKDTIFAQKNELQEAIGPLKDIRAEVKKLKNLKKGETNLLKKILKSIGISAKLAGSQADKLALLDQAIATVKGLVTLKKAEAVALSNCIHNKTDADTPAGSSHPRVVVVRYPGGEGIAVFAAVVQDSRLRPAGAYCAKIDGDPAFEIFLSTNPCPSGIQNKLCDGILGKNKVGRSIGGGAIYSEPPGEAAIGAVVGQTLADFGSKVYQVKNGEPGKTCMQVFGE